MAFALVGLLLILCAIADGYIPIRLFGGAHAASTKSNESILLAVSFPSSVCRKLHGCQSPQCVQNLNACLNPPSLKIPKAFLPVRQNWEGGIQSSFYVRTGFPDMEPWATVNRSAPSEQGLRVRVDVRLYARGGESLRQTFERSRKIRQALEQAEKVEGMVHYRNFRNEIFFDEYFVPTDKEMVIFYWCANQWIRPDGTPANVRCRAHTQLKELGLEYSFLRSEFARRNEIGEKVRSLIGSFIIKP